jgi:hypothetical protein
VLVARRQEKDLGLVLGELGEGAGRSAAGRPLQAAGWASRSPEDQETGAHARRGGIAGSCACNWTWNAVATRARGWHDLEPGGACGKSFWYGDIAAIRNLKCNLAKIISRFVDTFLMRSDGTIGRQ